MTRGCMVCGAGLYGVWRRVVWCVARGCMVCGAGLCGVGCGFVGCGVRSCRVYHAGVLSRSILLYFLFIGHISSSTSHNGYHVQRREERGT